MPHVERPRRGVRVLAWVLGGLIALIVLGVLAGYGVLRASLPRLDGGQVVPGLVAEVALTRDGLGVATLEGRDRRDLARALGFLHAQERFFQMDLLRRRGAGELSALVGSAALDVDRSARVHRFRDRARRVLARMPAPERALIAAYSAGVNHGLTQLGARPFEYFLLRTRPQPWREEDSFLVVYAMYFTLQDEDGAAELARRVARRQLPPALFTLLTAPGSEWDAPLRGGPLPSPPLPAASELAGWQPRFQPPDQIFPADENFPGSNSLAVSGQHSRTGAALLAGDMHLALGVPNIWYRAQLRYQAGAGSAEPVVVTGVTLPGVPLVVAGSNGQVAWAFTNSYGDWSDLVVLDEPHPGRYLTPGGELPIVQVIEKIEVAGGTPVSLTVEETVWGPVVSRDPDGRRCAYRWVAHDPEQAMNVSLQDLERAGNASQALEVATRVRLPAQNFVVADAQGRIGWTIAGAIPRRLGWDGQLAQSWSDGRHRWEGYLPPEQYPRLEDPASGRIWTANNRLVGAESIALLGDGGYDHGARAQQIRDALLALPRADEKALLAIQLDDRAPLLARWQKHLLRLLDAGAHDGSPARGELAAEVRRWSGRADVDSAAYRLVRGYRWLIADALHRAWLVDAAEFRRRGLTNHVDGYLLRILSERPRQLLPGPFADWRQLELAVVDTLIERYRSGGPLSARTWGERNTVRIRHPLSSAIPLVGSWLDAPAEPLPGDSHMPRVQGRSFGASQRMVVSPGHEKSGIFHMPGGQSGHPLSPFYLAGHADWAAGRPTPFLPGPATHTLRLLPEPRPAAGRGGEHAPPPRGRLPVRSR